MTDLWIEQPTRLRFAIGSLALFSVSLRAAVLDEHFLQLAELAGDVSDSTEPPDGTLNGVDVAIIRSQPVAHPLRRVVFLPRSVRYVPAQYHRYYVDLSGTFEAYLAHFSGKSRSTLLRKVRKFAEFSGGTIRWHVFREPQEMDEFYRLSRTISVKTYQERLLRAGLPDSADFLSELRSLAAQDAVRGWVLFHEERPIAYICCPARGRVLLYQHVGYDPDYRQWSPGTVLQHVILERLFEEHQFQALDFTEGEGQHKEFFATHSVFCADLFYFRRTLSNLALIGLHTSLDRTSRAAVAVTTGLGVKTALKKWIRRR